MNSETINWDDGWAELVDPLVEAHTAESEKKYPGVGEQHQKQAKEESRSQTRKFLAKYGFGVRYADEETPRKGCLWVLLLILGLVGMLNA